MCIFIFVTGFIKTDQIVTRTLKPNINDILMHCPDASAIWL